MSAKYHSYKYENRLWVLLIILFIVGYNALPMILGGEKLGPEFYVAQQELQEQQHLQKQQDLQERQEQRAQYWHDVQNTTGRSLMWLFFDWDNNGAPDYDNQRED